MTQHLQNKRRIYIYMYILKEWWVGGEGEALRI